MSTKVHLKSLLLNVLGQFFIDFCVSLRKPEGSALWLFLNKNSFSLKLTTLDAKKDQINVFIVKKFGFSSLAFLSKGKNISHLIINVIFKEIFFIFY